MTRARSQHILPPPLLSLHQPLSTPRLFMRRHTACPTILALRLLAGQLLGYTDKALNKAIRAGELIEVMSDE